MLLKGFEINSEGSAKVSDVTVCEVEFTAQAVEEVEPFAHWKNPVVRPTKVRMKKATISRSGAVHGGGLRS